jgi:Family of unknown function (DUF5706)
VTDAGTAALEYSRRLYANVLGWYESAERKAQLILTIDGLVLSVVTASLALTGDADRSFDDVGPVTWVLLALMFASFLGSLYSVVLCLVSRTAAGEREEAGAMWFFGMVARWEPERFRAAVRERAADDGFETDELLGQVAVLSRNVSRKHAWVNRAFVATALAFAFGALAIAARVVELAG